MSGPKISEYELEEMLRLEIEAERMLREAEELERELQRQHHRELLERRDEYVATLRDIRDALPENNELIKIGRERLGDESVATKQNGIEDSIDEQIAKLMELSNLQDNDELEKRLKSYPREIAKIKKSIGALGATANESMEKLNAVLTSAIASLFENDLNPDKEAISASDDGELARVKQTLEKLKELQNQQALPAAYQAKLQQAVEGIKRAKNCGNLTGYCAIELPELMKPCDEFLKLWAKDGQEYKKLSLQYELLLKQNGDNQVQMVPFDEKAVLKLKSLVAAEEVRAQQLAEKAYIAEVLDETMAEMGYDVIGQREVTKRSGKHFRNELYRYGEETAINVTYSDDGQIAMELGKLDQKDRVPTASESNYLANQMVIFCERFSELEKRLAKKGVKLGKRIALTPPSADYAQIINSNEYSMKEKQEKTSHRAKRQFHQGVKQERSC